MQNEIRLNADDTNEKMANKINAVFQEYWDTVIEPKLLELTRRMPVQEGLEKLAAAGRCSEDGREPAAERLLHVPSLWLAAWAEPFVQEDAEGQTEEYSTLWVLPSFLCEMQLTADLANCGGDEYDTFETIDDDGRLYQWLRVRWNLL